MRKTGEERKYGGLFEFGDKPDEKVSFFGKGCEGKASEMMTKRSSGKSSDGSKKLRPLPKRTAGTVFAHFRWERIKAYWFSKAGLKRVGKNFAACFC